MSFATFLNKTLVQKAETKPIVKSTQYAALLKPKGTLKEDLVVTKTEKKNYGVLLSTPVDVKKNSKVGFSKFLKNADKALPASVKGFSEALKPALLAVVKDDSKHPQYPAGTPGGKGGQFMPVGSPEYVAAITKAKDAAKALHAHIQGGGKDNDDTAKGHAQVIANEVDKLKQDGADHEELAKHLADTGLSKWVKHKHDLPMTSSEKEEVDKALKAAYKTYNKKMAAKKMAEHADLLTQAQAAKDAKGTDSKEYKVLMSKANKAAAAAMKYGETPQVVANTPHVVAAEKEAVKKDLHDAAYQSAHNLHMGVTDPEHDAKHVEAYNKAKEHFTQDDIAAIQKDAIDSHKAKVESGIQHLTESKAEHALHQQHKNKPKDSPEYKAYQAASAAYHFNYNHGAEYHGLNASDKATAVSKGYELANQIKHTGYSAPAGTTAESAMAHYLTLAKAHEQIKQDFADGKAPAYALKEAGAALEHAKKVATISGLSSTQLSLLDQKAKIGADLTDKSPEVKHAPTENTTPTKEAVSEPPQPVHLDTPTPAVEKAPDFSHLTTDKQIQNAVYEEAHKLSKMALANPTGLMGDPDYAKQLARHAAINKLAENKLGAGASYQIIDNAKIDAENNIHSLPHPESNSETNDPHGLNSIPTTTHGLTKALYDSLHAYHSAQINDPTGPLKLAKANAIAHFVKNKIGYSAFTETSAKAANDGKTNVYDPPKEQASPLAMFAPMLAPEGTKDDPHGLKELDTPSKMKNAVYQAAHNHVNASTPDTEHLNAIHQHAADALGKDVADAMVAQGSADAAKGKFKLPFKAKSKNKAKNLAQSIAATPAANAPVVATPSATPATTPAPEPTLEQSIRALRNTSMAVRFLQDSGTGVPTHLTEQHSAAFKAVEELASKQDAMTVLSDGYKDAKNGNYSAHGLALALYHVAQEKAAYSQKYPGADSPSALNKARTDILMKLNQMPHSLPDGGTFKIMEDAKIAFYDGHANNAIGSLGYYANNPAPQQTTQPAAQEPPKVDAEAEKAALKKAHFDAQYKLSHHVAQVVAGTQSGIPSEVSDAASKAYTEYANKHGDAEAMNVGQEASSKYMLDNPSQAPAPTPVTAPHTAPHTVAAIATMPTTKPEAEALNKTLAKQYYTLRKFHGDNNNHPEVKAAYEQWNELKNHMKQTMGYSDSYFSSTSGDYKSQANNEYLAEHAKKAQAVLSAKTAYKDAATAYHTNYLLKGEHHPDTLTSKATMEATKAAAKPHMPEAELNNLTEIAVKNAQQAKADLAKNAKSAIATAANKYHMAVGEHGAQSAQAIAAGNDLKNVGDMHHGAGNCTREEISNIIKDQKANADHILKQVEAFKKAVGNPTKAAENYDKNAANFKWLTGDALEALRKLGTKKYKACTADQKDAIKRYTGHGYKDMNKSLVASAQNATAKNLEPVLNESLGQDAMLRRNMPQKWLLKALGLATNNSTRQEMKNIDPAKLQACVGMVYHEPSFSSASYDPVNSTCESNTAKDSGGAILNIRAGKDVAKGFCVDKHSNISTEREVILQKGATYVIRSITKTNNAHGLFDYVFEMDLIGHATMPKGAA